MAGRNASSVAFLHELGLCLGAAGRGKEAIECLRKAVCLDPSHAGAWRTLGDQLSAAGDDVESRKAYDEHLKASTRHPQLIEATSLLRLNKTGKAERLVRDVLKKDPVDVVAIRMLAEIGIKLGQLADAQNLLERCLELAPDFHLARFAYAGLLMRRNALEESDREVGKLLILEPMNPVYLILKGAILARKGDHLPALQIYERLLGDYPRHAAAQMFYGHALKTVGRLDAAISAYRQAIALSPRTGEACWSLANLKTFRFTDEEIDKMRDRFQPEAGNPDDQWHLAFALGKAFEDREDFDQSFGFYEQDNAIRGRRHRHDVKINILDTARQIRALVSPASSNSSPADKRSPMTLQASATTTVTM
jgi:tetratricopeptide (TPR) repeat protein